MQDIKIIDVRSPQESTLERKSCYLALFTRRHTGAPGSASSGTCSAAVGDRERPSRRSVSMDSLPAVLSRGFPGIQPASTGRAGARDDNSLRNLRTQLESDSRYNPFHEHGPGEP